MMILSRFYVEKFRCSIFGKMLHYRFSKTCTDLSRKLSRSIRVQSSADDINSARTERDTGLSTKRKKERRPILRSVRPVPRLSFGHGNLSHFATRYRAQVQVTPGCSTPFAILVIFS